MTANVSSSNLANEVYIFVNSDKLATVSFLGAPLFIIERLPLSEDRIRMFVDEVSDKKQLSRFCTRNGLIESMAASAVSGGAIKRFVTNIAPYTTNFHGPVTSPKKSPANNKKKAAVKKAKKPVKTAEATTTTPAMEEGEVADGSEAETENGKPDGIGEGEVEDGDDDAEEENNEKAVSAEYTLANDY